MTSIAYQAPPWWLGIAQTGDRLLGYFITAIVVSFGFRIGYGH